MYNKEFLKYERLKQEVEMVKNFCANQYFAVDKCNKGQQCKNHVDRCYYPCIHYYMGNCKYGFSCHFSHSLKRQIPRPEPNKETCKKLYYENYCPSGSKCKFSHDLREYPCVYNSIGKCKHTADNCRYSHEKTLDVPTICFFNLMGGCNDPNCEKSHNIEGANIFKYISYEGPI